MRLKAALIAVLVTAVSFFSSGQAVDDVGDGWMSAVDSALCLIESSAPEFWPEVSANCKHVTFWNGDHSTSSDSTVVISAHDMRLGSVNNIACVIIHESHHLEVARRRLSMAVCKEELECYMLERAFVDRVSADEAWLVAFIYRSILRYTEECD